ncbi:hypothetical protein Poli38472_009688 [Pythium oligandrum]|uniref:Cilia- and flagella-associated protein 418 n=1 Tax=Pythium oligandrum TaxID=41045 RepID=A0A8K1CG95_PYTOL|nr:hypothetical protein Poli38472_009688 [Pythium oligandrum]|eukprot:TMW62195.1 hypothetical protein Poli38472_009688 [Pythium oligandrum]
MEATEMPPQSTPHGVASASPALGALSESLSIASKPLPSSAASTTQAVTVLRGMETDDIDQVRDLHEEWFPIRYQQSFYDGAAQGIWRETGHPLFARLAVEVTMSPATLKPTSPTYDYQDWYPAPSTAQGTILGAVMASTIPLTTVEDPDLIDDDDYIHTHAMYILTLGSRSSVRRRGIASALLAECIEEARRQPHCGAVYLHVKADNVQALRFYEKNGFQNLRYLHDYYTINGVRHSAYLYILYVNGAMGPTNWLEVITKPLVSFFSMATSGLKRWIEAFLDDEEEHKEREKKSSHRPSAPETTVSIAYWLQEQREISISLMDLQDLLDEVEGVLQDRPSDRKAVVSRHDARINNSTVTSSGTAVKKSTSDIDDLLNMIDDDDEKPDARHAVHPHRGVTSTFNTKTSTSSTSSYASSSSPPQEFHTGGTKKCSTLMLGGGDVKRGLNTAFASHNVCLNLRCNECDFTVVQFLGKKWASNADYMFFRENVPNESKLRARMEIDPESAAYACQCKWLSIDVCTRIDMCRVKWSCAGH